MKKSVQYIILALSIIIFVTIGLVLFANKEYSIYYISDGEIIKVTQHKGMFVEEPPEPKDRDGYAFEGWYFDDGSYTQEFSNDYFKDKKIRKHYYLYAKWVEQPMVKVNYNTYNNQVVDDIYLEKGEKIENAPTLTKSGSIFLGWYTNESFNMPFDFDKNIEKDTTLYAKWLDSYKLGSEVDIVLDYGGQIETIKTEYGKKLDVDDIFYIGHILQGVFYDESCVLPFDFDEVIVAGFTIYIKGESVEDIIDVFYHSDKGEVTPHIAFTYGESIDEQILTEEGYNFLGWFCDEETTIPYDFSLRASETLNLYAKWEVKDTSVEEKYIYVTFMLNGGKLSDDNTTYTYDKDKAPSLPTPTKQNSIFEGWYFDEELEEKYSVEKGDFSKDFTLYAQWKKIINTSDFSLETSLDGETAILTEYIGSDKDVIIPEDISNAKIIAIGLGAFKGKNIESVEIPKGVKTISDEAFSGCVSLKSLYFVEKNITYIGNKAFYQTALEQIGFNKLTNIGEYAFSDCDNLKKVLITNNPTIKNNAFSDCDNLKEVIITYVTTIPDYAFANCKNLDTLTANSLVTIKQKAFYNNEKLSAIDLKNVKTISSEAFSSCNLQNINLDSIEFLGGKAFYNNENLTYVNIGKDLVEYENNASETAFLGCDFVCFDVSNDNPSISSNEGSILSKNGSEVLLLAGMFIGNLNGYDVLKGKIPEGVERLNRQSLSNSSGVVELSLPSTLNYIEDGSLSNLFKLEKLELAESNTTFELRSDKNLYSISEKYLVRYIPNAPYNTFILPSDVLGISFGAFANVKYLENIDLNNNLTKLDFGCFYEANSLKSVSNTEKIKSIDGFAFGGCNNLSKTFTVWDNVETIGSFAFYSSNIENLILGDNVTTLESGALGGMNNLKSVTFGKNINIIESGLFEESGNIEEIIITCESVVSLNNVDEDITIKVDASLLNQYKATYPDRTILAI